VASIGVGAHKRATTPPTRPGPGGAFAAQKRNMAPLHGPPREIGEL